MMTGEKPKDIFCDLCEEEEATTYCDDCQYKVCESCKISHVKENQTKDHYLADIDQVTLSILKVSCSLCDGQAENFCSVCNVRLCTACAKSHHKLDINLVYDKAEATLDRSDICSICDARAGTICTECDVHLCTNCSNGHHKLSDTLTPGKKIINKKQDFEKKLYKSKEHPGESKTETTRTYKRTCCSINRCWCFCNKYLSKRGSSNVDPLNGQSTEEKKMNRPGKPLTRRVLVDSVDIEWDGVPIFRDNDSYQVFITNTKTGTWNSKFCKVNSAHISGLLPGTTYIFKVRLVQGNGEESEYSENSDEVTTKEEQKKEAYVPGKPHAERMFSDSVDIVWDGVSNFSEGDAYQVRIENIQTGKWDCKFFTKNQGKIRDLQPGETYVIKVRLVRANGEESKYSENSEKLRIKEETKQKDRPGKLITKTVSVDSHTEKPKKETDRPGKPTVTEIYSDSVNIVWNSVQQFKKGDLYQVRLETVPEGTWKLQDYEITNVKIKGLKPNTSYLFKVRWVKSNGEESIYSEKSDIITTTLSFASKIVGESKLVKKGSGELDVYELPMEELLDARNKSANSKRFDIGPRSMNTINEKTIMLVGATGSGKSTFVDLLANYVFGVRLDDPFRFTVISDEDRKKRKDEAQAQTDFISCYSFNKQAGTRLNYRINVIDTPGFGDVRGVERDKKTVEEIRQLFGETGTKGIQSIDAVCFLLKAPDARLTESQKYIFKGVLSLFSQDIEENICAIITFADGGEPKVLAAVQAEKITFNKIFRFNNSALFSDPSNNSLISTFWNMGLQSLEELFNHINTLEPKSIQLSKEVLNERHLLEETYQELQKSICDSIGTIEELNSEMNTFKDNEKIIENNKDFKYTIEVKKEIKGKLSDNEWATNCFKCEKTCHGNCTGMLESVRNLCWVMSWETGTCSKCLCDESDHKRENYRYFTVKEEVEKMYSEKLEHYQKATGKNLHLADVLDEMEDDIAVNTVKIIQMLKEITNCMNRLNEIALRPNVSGMSNPIDQIIYDEENAIMPNKDRITILKKFRDIASGKVILQDTSDKRRHWKYFNSKP